MRRSHGQKGHNQARYDLSSLTCDFLQVFPESHIPFNRFACHLELCLLVGVFWYCAAEATAWMKDLVVTMVQYRSIGAPTQRHELFEALQMPADVQRAFLAHQARARGEGGCQEC